MIGIMKFAWMMTWIDLNWRRFIKHNLNRQLTIKVNPYSEHVVFFNIQCLHYTHVCSILIWWVLWDILLHLTFQQFNKHAKRRCVFVSDNIIVIGFVYSMSVYYCSLWHLYWVWFFIKILYIICIRKLVLNLLIYPVSLGSEFTHVPSTCFFLYVCLHLLLL